MTNKSLQDFVNKTKDLIERLNDDQDIEIFFDYIKDIGLIDTYGGLEKAIEIAVYLAEIEDYHSHNTERLNVEGVKNLISKLALVKKELFGEEVADFLV